jgi:hypothetical protein
MDAESALARDLEFTAEAVALVTIDPPRRGNCHHGSDEQMFGAKRTPIKQRQPKAVRSMEWLVVFGDKWAREGVRVFSAQRVGLQRLASLGGYSVLRATLFGKAVQGKAPNCIVRCLGPR